MPIYLSALNGAVENEGNARSREVYGLSTANGYAHLDQAGIVPPRNAGIVTGPTGALINKADERGLDSVGLLVESVDTLPDLKGARIIINRGIQPIAEVDIDTAALSDPSFEMSPVAEAALDRIRESTDGTSRVQPTPTFH